MNWFKQFFDNTKKDKTRQNLLVSIDNKDTGDQEVLTLKTTSSEKIIILELNLGEHRPRVGVNPHDLQDALDRIKQFIDARPGQPASQQALGAKHLEAAKETEERTVEQIKTIEKKFDLST